MARRILTFDPPDRFIAGTLGEPGKRVFHLQAIGGGRATTVVVEKTQVAILARRIAEMLKDLGEGSAALKIPAADAPIALTQPRLSEPVDPAFRVERPITQPKNSLIYTSSAEFADLSEMHRLRLQLIS